MNDPTVSSFAEFLYEPEKPLAGDLTDYAYHQRGALSYVVELWDVFTQWGLPVKKPFIDSYTQIDPTQAERLAEWDQKNNEGRIFQPWKPFQHPQLGAVEIGGPNGWIGVSNPTLAKLPEVCEGMVQATLRVGSLIPQLEVQIERGEVKSFGTQIEQEFRVHVQNTGYLGTYGLESARGLTISEPIRCTIQTQGGATLLTPDSSIVDLGHLKGWGRGRYGATTLFGPTTEGSVSERKMTFRVRVNANQSSIASVEISIGSCRLGRIQKVIELG